MQDNWINRFLTEAQNISKWSKDPSTKVGAVLIRPDRTIASVGFNGFPKKIKDTKERLENREVKYKIVMHGEENAIHFCRDGSLEGYSLFTYPFMPCPHCACICITRGIQYVYAPYFNDKEHPRYDFWNKEFELTRELFAEAGVFLTEVNL